MYLNDTRHYDPEENRIYKSTRIVEVGECITLSYIGNENLRMDSGQRVTFLKVYLLKVLKVIRYDLLNFKCCLFSFLSTIVPSFSCIYTSNFIVVV